MIPRPDSLPPLFIFVERLAQRLDNQQLSEWVDTHVEQPKVKDLRWKLADEAKKEPWNYLVIEISSKEPAAVDAYYWDALEQKWSEHMMEPCAPPTLETVRTALPKIFEKVEVMCRGKLTVELLLPRELLCEDLHDWEVPFEPESEILGRRSPVLLRSRDRLRNFKEVDRDRWRRLSQRIKGRLQQRVGSVEWLGRDHDLSKVRTTLDRHDSGEYVSLRFEPPWQQTKPMDALSAAIWLGAPYACWRSQPTDAWDLFEREVEKFVLADDVPQTVRDRRNAADGDIKRIWSSFNVLWDDPERAPPCTPARMPT